MSKTKFAVFMYLMTAALTTFFLLQQLAVPLPGLSVHYWPVALGGMLLCFTCLLPAAEFAVNEQAEKQSKGIVFPSPGVWEVRFRVGCALLLLPFLCWLYQPVRYSAASWEYFCLMSLLALFSGLVAILNVTGKLCEIAVRHCPGKYALSARVAHKVWMYGVLVPVLAVTFGKIASDVMFFGFSGASASLLSLNSALLTAGAIPGYIGKMVCAASLVSTVASLMIFCTFREKLPGSQDNTPQQAPCSESRE